MLAAGTCRLQAAPCAERISDLAAQALPASRPGRAAEAEYDFGKLSGCLRSEHDERRVLVLALGEYAPPLEIRLTSKASGEAVLPAEVDVVSHAGERLAHYPFETFRKRGADYSATLFINAPEAREGYIVVRASAADLGRTSRLVAGKRVTNLVVTPQSFGLYADGTERHSETPFAEAGVVEVRIEPATARSVPAPPR